MLILGKECSFWLQELPCMATMTGWEKSYDFNVARNRESEREERQADKSDTLNRVKNSREKARFRTDLKHSDS